MVRIFIVMICVWMVWPAANAEAVVSTKNDVFRWNVVDSVEKSQGTLLGLRVANARLQGQLEEVDNDLSDMRKEYYSGRYSRVKPGLLMGLGGGAGLGIGASLLSIGLITLPLGGLNGMMGFLVAGGILSVVGIVCLAIGGVWMARVNRRRRRMLRLMRNARYKRFRILRRLRNAPRGGQRTSLPPSHQNGLLALPQVHTSNYKVSF